MIKKVYGKLCKWEINLVIILLIFSIFTLTGAAILRSFGMPLQGSMDIVILCFTWAIFLAADISFREGEFIKVDILTQKLPLKIQNILEYFVYLVIFVFLCALIYFGTVLSFKSLDRTIQGFPSLSFIWVTLSLPVGSLLMLITLCIKIYKSSVKGHSELGK